jgi:hypothetical protein
MPTLLPTSVIATALIANVDVPLHLFNPQTLKFQAPSVILAGSAMLLLCVLFVNLPFLSLSCKLPDFIIYQRYCSMSQCSLLEDSCGQMESTPLSSQDTNHVESKHGQGDVHPYTTVEAINEGGPINQCGRSS